MCVCTSVYVCILGEGVKDAFTPWSPCVHPRLCRGFSHTGIDFFSPICSRSQHTIQSFPEHLGAPTPLPAPALQLCHFWAACECTVLTCPRPFLLLSLAEPQPWLNQPPTYHPLPAHEQLNTAGEKPCLADGLHSPAMTTTVGSSWQSSAVPRPCRPPPPPQDVISQQHSPRHASGPAI